MQSACVVPLLIKEMKFAEFVSTGQLLISKFHQLSGGNSGSGCGNAPPRAESMAHAGTIELVKESDQRQQRNDWRPSARQKTK